MFTGRRRQDVYGSVTPCLHRSTTSPHMQKKALQCAQLLFAHARRLFDMRTPGMCVPCALAACGIVCKHPSSYNGDMFLNALARPHAISKTARVASRGSVIETPRLATNRQAVGATCCSYLPVERAITLQRAFSQLQSVRAHLRRTFRLFQPGHFYAPMTR